MIISQKPRYSIHCLDDQMVLQGKMRVEDAKEIARLAVFSAITLLEEQDAKELIPLMVLNMIDGITSAVKEHIDGEDVEYVKKHSQIN